MTTANAVVSYIMRLVESTKCSLNAPGEAEPMMNYSGVADLAIYPSSSRDDLLDERRGVELPDGAHEHLIRAMVRTQFDGGDKTIPTRFEILSLRRHRTFMSPKLVLIRGPQVIIKAYVPRASGVLCGLQEVFLVILPAETFGFPTDDHPVLGDELKED